MGLTIRSKIKTCDIELVGGYGMLLTIRKEVAKLWDKEFGEHYSKLGSIVSLKDFEEFDKKN